MHRSMQRNHGIHPSILSQLSSGITPLTRGIEIGLPRAGGAEKVTCRLYTIPLAAVNPPGGGREIGVAREFKGR